MLNKGICLSTVISGCTVIMLFPTPNAFLLTVNLSIISVGVLTTSFNIAKDQSIINDIEKQKFMINACAKLNNAKLNPALFFGLSEKAKKVINSSECAIYLQ